MDESTDERAIRSSIEAYTRAFEDADADALES
jgi:hypothetical protein